ncbi:MAG: hypothetical protein HZB56_19265 [Deltaproteobacteria bacterium]|nr:hypothetical protein [Deltaproteobacteria bacterium]
MWTLAAGAARAAQPSNDGVDPNAIDRITRDGYPDVYAAWGDGWVKRINALMPKAAKKASASSECDRVEYVGYSGRSTPRKTIVLYVDCTNGKRFFLSETDIHGRATPESKQGKTSRYSDDALLRACEEGVKTKMTYPLTFRRRLTATSVYRAPGGNVSVDFVFDAKNKLGAELPYRARCVADDQGMHTAEVTNY